MAIQSAPVRPQMIVHDLDERTWQTPGSNDFEGYYRLRDRDVDVKIKVRLHLDEIGKQTYGDVKLWSFKNMNWAPVFTWNAPEVKAQFTRNRRDNVRTRTVEAWWYEDVETMLRYAQLILHSLVQEIDAQS